MKYFSIIALLLLGTVHIEAQITQTVRGEVVDSDTRSPISRARVYLMSDSTARGILTNKSGEFVLTNVPTGRHTLKVSQKGYITKVVNNVVVNSGKQTVLNFRLQVAAYSEEEETETLERNGEVSNEMAMVSAREFSVDETIRYAGSRGDPIRTALNFAGVQGLDDSRNDLVIRGNSPYGMAIQHDGVILMNSNHFATAGTNGGPLSKISFKCLDNSDFYKGSMPAEFGNALSGVFDLRLKTGNNKEHEQGIYIGVLGADVFAEGPLSRIKGSSFIFNYRRSVISLALDAGLDFGTSAVPFYQDLNFKLHFPTKKGGSWSFWGITGNSRSTITLSDDAEAVNELYGDNDRDQYLESGLDVIGLTYRKPFNSSTFLRTTAAYSTGYVFGNDEYIVSRDTLSSGMFNPANVRTTPFMGFNFNKDKYSFNTELNKRLGKNKLLKLGAFADVYDMKFQDSIRVTSLNNWADTSVWFNRWNAEEGQVLYRYFAQYKQQFGKKFEATLGFHGMYFTLGEGQSLVEPRLGMSYNYAKGKVLSFGGGLYSQIQPPYMHYYTSQNLVDSLGPQHNWEMGLTKSWHSSLAHSWAISDNLTFLAEAYYQYLFNIPVETQPSAFSLINSGTGFSRVFADDLENSGTAYNYGLELTLQKFFSDGYSFLINGTLFESKYRGSDGVLRNTNFNGNYMCNALGTKEFDLSDNSRIGLGINLTYAGGRRYGEFDEEASQEQRDLVWKDENFNENRYRDYFRTDFRINYVINRAKVTHEIAFDLLNVFDTGNVLEYAWAPGINQSNNFALRQQIGFLPLFYYKLDF